MLSFVVRTNYADEQVCVCVCVANDCDSQCLPRTEEILFVQVD